MKSIATKAATKQTTPKDFNLFVLTWPIFLELFLFMLMGSADTFMLSEVSDNAVSAVGAANQYIFIAILIMEVIGNGASIVIAQYIGSNRREDAARISAIAVTLNLMIGVVISTCFILFGKSLLQSVNLQGEILHYAQTYITIVGGGLFLQAVINTLASIIRTYGYTKESMLVSLGMNVIHVIGNYLLIFGHLGFPELGVEGAAISTVVSRLISLFIFFWLLYRLMEVKIAVRDYFSFSMEYIKKILRIGIPSAFEQVTYNACQTVFLYYATLLGAVEMASRQYVMNISTFIYLFSLAIGMGTAIITGRMVGAGRTEEAYKRVWRSLRWGLFLTIAVNIVIILFRVPIIELFTEDREIIALATQILLLSILLESGRTFNLILINSLRAAGDAKFPVYMGLLSMVCMSLPLGYYLAFSLDLGLAGIWLAIAADEWMRGIIMFFRWRSRAWEQKSLVHPSA
ncbi:MULTISPECIES: MATE family efflux transporter [Brevibacillus]|jgi:putative MATE family efflux protein|uniref:MATE efflux family protein n=2 Tax=Brevibacillus borstelensis TaxID=45462 RepID=M8DIC7_9BACL|nr:MATE family efflux transporter [Brevibacillus borstelensis]EMT53343.1 MATE efflux family protein [Brevibacillus borstelensis AK1]MBE5396369.1 MATE family efflux transporter [Brevibacillus borstelensis]MCM3622085.1 MATE family efflux transporter [Brevibacillus borstelensis]MED1851485.1 MATE family efflux transporter [Brevibacillus borstelensis]MED1875610.1 MATE family efflux transporter [Brevibacillus borstelensis]